MEIQNMIFQRAQSPSEPIYKSLCVLPAEIKCLGIVFLLWFDRIDQRDTLPIPLRLSFLIQ